MHKSSDTPPDGDFARYIEQLSASSARTQALPSPGASADAGSGFSALRTPSIAPAPADKVPSPVFSLGAAVKWLVIAVVGIQIISAFFSWAGWLMIPLMVAAGLWLAHWFKSAAAGNLPQGLRHLLEEAAKDLKQRKRP